MGWIERKCKLCGKSILMLDMEDGQQFPVDWPPTDVTIITNPRKQQNCRPYCLPSGRIVQARKPEKAEPSVQAYVPHQLTCEVYNRKTG